MNRFTKIQNSDYFSGFHPRTLFGGAETPQVIFAEWVLQPGIINAPLMRRFYGDRNVSAKREEETEKGKKEIMVNRAL